MSSDSDSDSHSHAHEIHSYSSQASLVSMGERFKTMDIWPVVERTVTIKQKVHRHTPTDKLLDCLIGMLAGGVGVVEVNTRVRPDMAVQRAFGRQGCAEQSTVSRTVNACTAHNVHQMRTAVRTIFQQHSRSYRHDYTTGLQLIDMDVTGMPAGRQGEGVLKGYFADQKNCRGRQLGRVLATHYDEIVVEQLYDGKRQLDVSLPGLLHEAELALGLGLDTAADAATAAVAAVQLARQNTVFRVDAGGGTDDDINLLLEHGYHIFIKLKHWKRAKKLADRVSVNHWHPDSKITGREVGWVPTPHAHGYIRPTRQLALRNLKKDGTWSYHVLVFTLSDEQIRILLDPTLAPSSDPVVLMLRALHFYDLRGGGIETQFKSDKQGLGLSHRNTQRFAPQEMLVLLGQLAHNFIIWARDHLARLDARFDKFGIKRMVRDVFHIDGAVTLTASGTRTQVTRVTRVVLNVHHPWAAAFQSAFATGHPASRVMNGL